MSTTRIVPTGIGDARITIDEAEDERAALVLGHGAGGGINAPDLAALAAALPGQGITVVRVEQPYRVAGKRLGPSPAKLDQAWREVIAKGIDPRGPLVVGGRSSGARVACRTATATGAAAIVALAFPLHPPGRPERSRAAELVDNGTPTLVIQGERDPFGRPAEFPRGNFVLQAIPDADHGFAVPKSAKIDRAQIMKDIARVVGEWLRDVLN